MIDDGGRGVGEGNTNRHVDAHIAQPIGPCEDRRRRRSVVDRGGHKRARGKIIAKTESLLS